MVGGALLQEAAQDVDSSVAAPSEQRPHVAAAHLLQHAEVAVVLVVQVRGLGGEEVRAAAERGGDGVRVLALVRGDHHRRVLERPLHPLLHHALLRRAPVVAPAQTITN